MAKAIPALHRADDRLREAERTISDLQALVAALRPGESSLSQVRSEVAPIETLRIEVTRGGRAWYVDPDLFELLGLHNGDRLRVVPEELAKGLPHIWNDVHMPVSKGRTIRVPPEWGIFDYKGFSIPVHLAKLTGTDPDMFNVVSRELFRHYSNFIGFSSGMRILDLGSGVGKLAFQLLDYLTDEGQYLGLDIILDSIIWCSNNITSRYPNFSFHHFDIVNDLYNPLGTLKTTDITLPVADGSIDRVILASVFTHLLEDEVAHYLAEIKRVLAPDGLVHASFFLYSEEAIVAARTLGNTPWAATFSHDYGHGVYGSDPTYPRGAVAFTDSAIRRLIGNAGLTIKRPYVKGRWSGLHADPEFGQDAVIFGL
jgi:SAM-dependent methyltransferase